jgi:hypothetical protein
LSLDWSVDLYFPCDGLTIRFLGTHFYQTLNCNTKTLLVYFATIYHYLLHVYELPSIIISSLHYKNQ